MNITINPQYNYSSKYNYNKRNRIQRYPQSNSICSDTVSFKSKSISKLYEEYNWYINIDRLPAIQSFLKIEEKAPVMERFLSEILITKDRSFQFIESLISQPREINNVIDKLSHKIGNNSAITQTFLPDNPYTKAYTNYIETKFNNAHTLYELLKIRPDWKGAVLLEKYKQLKGNENLEIGKLPSEISQNHYEQIKNYLKNYMEFGIKNKKKIKSLTLDNRTYEFAYFTEGRSDKSVFGIFTPERKKYVIKMGIPEKRSLDAPFALGTLAKIDGYLTANRSRNSAPICYYNHKDNLSIYKYIEHIPTAGNINDLTTIKMHLPDFKKLSLTYNDNIGNKNCFLLCCESNDDLVHTEGFFEGINNFDWISVDNDHVTFSNRFHPMLDKYHSALPNAMQMFF